ncbi:hypothetical protein PT306_02660 [Metamycoplasma hyosynoviae]|uniref:hypothetical protein n=1 Tax=Metamycoplasma hyosynoviae TaxID=29559 RepID=UPI00235876AF|nr:hypothetical protein [Metamycoplasma hyosynoviae]MDC8919271.1 hypothetical protein [Metamycoplasma hyosynoviae]MDC8921730.1 hypothetical protein [Metamycoplasma hyosynoviae]MDD1379170.1 hypothetical protein [Metamycoplasma hyosynoviae]
MLKLPTYKDLGINIKEILWKNDFETFQDFKNAYSAPFCAILGHYLHKNNKHTAENFSLAYNVIFYYGYINQKREKELLNILSEKGFAVKPSFLMLDAIIGIDLIASFNDKTYVIQVKPNNKFNNLKHIKTYATKRNYYVIFAYKKQNKWFFYDKNMKEITFI